MNVNKHMNYLYTNRLNSMTIKETVDLFYEDTDEDIDVSQYENSILYQNLQITLITFFTNLNQKKMIVIS